MVKISKIKSLSRQCKPNGKLTIPLLILLAVCVIGRPAGAETSIYTFDSDQSTVVRSGGIVGLQKTFSVTGQFQLTVDSDAGVASFEMVDANLADDTGSEYGPSLDEIFNMTGLAGTIVDEKTIEFKGKTADGTESDVRLMLSFMDGLAHMTGNTTPPPNSADMFFYDVNAVAIKKYAGGTGEPNDPYQIATAEDLMLLGETPEDYDKHFILTADVDLDPNLPGRKVFDKAVIAPCTVLYGDWIEVFGAPFTGVLDGNGHKITNLTVAADAGNGSTSLLGYVDDPNAQIKDLQLIDPYMRGDIAGSLVGSLMAGTIARCCVKGGSVEGASEVGGLVGRNGSCNPMWAPGHAHCSGGTITNCYAAVSVGGNESVGGLVGFNGSGAVSHCYSNGAVTGGSYAGGLIGVNIMGSVANCYSNGSVSGTERVGGLLGSNGIQGTVADCYSTGAVSGGNIGGGLVGGNSGSVTRCLSVGAVSGNSHVGGLVGTGRAAILGGIDGIVTQCFWDIQSSGQVASEGGTGKMTAEMQTADTFLEAGWDFVDETENGTEDIWSICEGTNYPCLVWQIPVGDFVCPDGITIDDFSFFLEHWLDDNCDSSNNYCEGTDLDQSGTVDVFDLEIFFENWPAEQ